MKRVCDLDEFIRERARVSQMIDLASQLPRQILRHPPELLGLFDADLLWTASWFDRLRALRPAADFWLMVVAPDPEHYYRRHFSTFPLLLVERDDTFSAYLQAVHADPGGSPADAIRYHSRRLCVYDDELRWLCYCDRDLDLGVVAARDSLTAREIQRTFEHDLLSPTVALRTLLRSKYLGQPPDDVESALIRNYHRAADREGS